MKYVGFFKKSKNLKTPEEAREFCAKLTDGIFFGIYFDYKLIGYTTLSHFNGHECEFGIFVGEKNYWGHGVGLEITKRMVEYAFEYLGMRKVILTTYELHERAIRMYKRAGFKVEKIIPNDRTILLDGKWQTSGTILMAVNNALNEPN